MKCRSVKCLLNAGQCGIAFSLLYQMCVCILPLPILGFCLVEVTIPNSGDNILGDAGDENIVLFCEITQDGLEQSTVWSLMVEGQTGQSTIGRGDPGFNITGDPLPGNPGFFFNTNLTILELTADLNNAIIYCGVPATLLAANFTIRLYSEFMLCYSVCRLLLSQ